MTILKSSYDITNWYWVVEGMDGVVYSSARQAYVPITDIVYVVWLNNGTNAPTYAKSQDALVTVFNDGYPAGWPMTPQQAAAAAYGTFISSGIAITSASTPAINGTYPIDVASQGNLMTEAQFISAFSEFTNGQTSGLQWWLQNGTPVTFPNVAVFMTVAKAIGQQVSAAKVAAATNQEMPSSQLSVP
jgi:hypothetical protein